MAEEQNDKEQNQLNIELSEEIAEGTYVNLVMIAHSTSEFVVDFVRTMPGVPKAKVKSRIILTPDHAKKLFAALGDNIKKYEDRNGQINEGKDNVPFPINFGGQVGEA